jgi:hypothetical protein
MLAPGFLLLLPLLGLVLWQGAHRIPRSERVIRAVCLGCLIFALTRPVVSGSEERTHQVLVLDHRAGPEVAVKAQGLLAALDRDDRRVLIEVGGPLGEEALGDHPAERLRATSLADALRMAAAGIPNGARGAVTLVGDGLEQTGSASNGLLDLQRRGLPLHIWSVGSVLSHVRPVAHQVESVLRAGATGHLRVTLAGDGGSTLVRLVQGEQEWARVTVPEVSGRAQCLLSFEPSQGGFEELELLVECEGQVAVSEHLTLAVQDPLRVLALTGRTEGSGKALAGIVGAGFQIIEHGVGASASQDPLPDPGDFDLVLVDDRPASQLPAEFQARLVQAVQQQGTGLFASGGEAAYGPGGWHESPLASILPVESVQKEEKRDPSVSLVIIIDTSGSMGGNRVQLAKEVSRLALKRLLPHDKVGIVEFYGAKRWAAPLQPASNRIELERALNRMQAGGGTVILPAIEEAWYGLKNVSTRYKHVIILTDGGVESGAFEPLLRAMAGDGITISTVLIAGAAHSEFLVNIANWGKGRFYGVPNRFNLPEILLKQPASAKLPAWRPVVTPVRAVGGPRWWGDQPSDSVPDLAGHVETRLRKGAEEVLTTGDGHRPILASWRHGLGRVTAMTSELTGPGCGDWQNWDGRGAFLARALRRTADDLGGSLRFELDRRGAQLTVRARRRDGSNALPRAEIAGRELQFTEEAPGWFLATDWLAPKEIEGDLQVTASSFYSGGTVGESMRLVLDAPRPRDLTDPDKSWDLPALSARCGGIILGSFRRPPVGGPQDPVGVTELRPLLALLALLTFLFGIWTRRRPATTSNPERGV